MTEKTIPVLTTMLTREEFLTVWAFYWVAMLWNCYGVEEMPEEAADEIWSSYGKSMRWAIAKLGAEYGMQFEGLEVDDNGGIHFKQWEAIEPKNMLYVHRMENGMWPYPPNAIQTAMQKLWRDRIQIDMEPMRNALTQVTTDIEQARKEMFATKEASEDMEAIGETIEYLMNRAGYVRAGKAVN